VSGSRSEAPSEQRPKAVARVSYDGLQPASLNATQAARGSSKKTDTRCELALRRALWLAGCRYRKHLPGLPGRPDIAFPGAKLAVFCDGDFWHGRDWESRRRKLRRGTNAEYWLAKIERNIERDLQNTGRLQEMGWTVLRFWESQIRSDLATVTRAVLAALRSRKTPLPPLTQAKRRRKKGGIS
jgi:DNA mismatch endonuclease (patch repair protein)